MTAPITEDRPTRRTLPTVILTAIVLGAIAVFLWNAVETSTARVNATTSANSMFSAGTVDLAQPFTVVDLLFDANNLFPGAEIEGCVEVEYRGSLPADVRLYSRTLGGTGLDEFVDIRITLPEVATCDDVRESKGRLYFVGTLAEFWRGHDSYHKGLRLTEMTTGQTAVLHVAANLVDDNAAQGLRTDFAMTVEARP